MLAFDGSIEVAGPVLQHSQRLDTKGCLFLHTPIEARNAALGKPTKRPRYSFCLSLIGNTTGLSFSGGGALLTFGNNAVRTNGADGAFSGGAAIATKETHERAAFGRL